MALEKKTRQGGDLESTCEVAEALVTACYNAKDYKALNESLSYIAKRRGQLKEVTKKITQSAMKFVTEVKDEEKKIELISVLRSITEGKIYVEVERARLTKILADIKEAKGDVVGAANILQEVQVETYGAMEAREKIEFILNQIRLCLAKGDHTRAQIISKKIAKKALSGDDVEDLKLKYYHLLVTFYKNENKYLDICRSFKEIYDAKCVQDDKTQWTRYLKLISFFVVLAQYGNEQSDFLHRLRKERQLLEVPEYQSLLRLFATTELINWPQFGTRYKAELSSLEVFSDGDWGTTLWKDLHSRVVEHNIRVIAKFYQRITRDRLCELLDLDQDETERYISIMVSSKTVWARIDRPKGIICFRPKKEPADVLNDWSHDVQELLGTLDKTCHLVQREIMVYK
eukprot:TRINITY_DN3032_c0_g1_i2.p1 TRINITY_DN3032_c0_g1~~TRINITY_DN3032_c0_g1_i2.p1  ORF type:complete len:470 (+),score=106.44 TRINITY_DN3032_c0_g1_i2:208-1410(+)